MPEPTVPDLALVIREISEEMAQRSDRGAVADYIPELARVDPGQFGMAVIDAAGRVFAGGDSETPFSIQSVSKVFTLTLALGMVGDRLWKRVGRELRATRSTPSSSWRGSAACRAIRSSMRAPSRSPT